MQPLQSMQIDTTVLELVIVGALQCSPKDRMIQYLFSYLLMDKLSDHLLPLNRGLFAINFRSKPNRIGFGVII